MNARCPECERGFVEPGGRYPVCDHLVTDSELVEAALDRLTATWARTFASNAEASRSAGHELICATCGLGEGHDQLAHTFAVLASVPGAKE